MSAPVGAGRRIDLAPDEVVLEDFETHRSIIVGIVRSAGSARTAEESLQELEALAATVGAETVATHLQVRDAPNPSTYVGKGKVAEIRDDALAYDATLIIFDDELTPAQLRNLEKAFGGRRVLDRAQLILDIFAQNATTREGRVQVELAQLKYRLPRLRGRGAYLSRLGGGIGTRGPGETILEVDRRRIQNRISTLRRELDSLDRTRSTKRKARRRGRVPAVSIVGYTNSGKSTLLNAFTGAGVGVADELFSTLDTTVRRMELDGRGPILVTDTVGFVRKLPHELVQAFRSTLEEGAEADLIVHVADASVADPIGNVAVVRSVLSQIGAQDTPELLVWNKSDLIAPGILANLMEREAPSLATSAVSGFGVPELIEEVCARLDSDGVECEMLIPYDQTSAVNRLHEIAHVIREDHTNEGTRLMVRMRASDRPRFAEFLSESAEDGDDASKDLDAVVEDHL